MHTQTHSDTHIHKHRCTHTHTHTHTYTHTFTYTQTHTHIDTHKHTHTVPGMHIATARDNKQRQENEIYKEERSFLSSPVLMTKPRMHFELTHTLDSFSSKDSSCSTRLPR